MKALCKHNRIHTNNKPWSQDRVLVRTRTLMTAGKAETVDGKQAAQTAQTNKLC